MAEPDYSEFTPVEEPIASVQPQEQDWSEFTPVDEVAPDLSQMGVHQGSTVAFDKTWLPAVGSVDAFKQGYNDINRASQMVLGDNIVGNNVGKIPGVIGGAAMSVGTLLNPIGKAIAGVPKVVQAGAEALSGEKGNAYRTISGQREVLPNVQPHAYNTGSQILDTALNTGSELVTQVRKDPTLLASASPKGVAKVVNKLNPTLSKPPKAVASNIVAEPIQFIKPNKGKITGEISEVFDAKDHNLIARSLGTDKALVDATAEAIRHDPKGTVDLVGLDKASDSLISKITEEVKLLKGQVQEPSLMDGIADKLESSIHKGMSPDDVAIIEQQAAKYRNQAYTIDDVHKTMKYLGKKLVHYWGKEDSNSVFAKEVMAKERGLLNEHFLKSIEEVGGERATQLHKKMSNQIKLRDAIEEKADRMAKLIPAQYRGSLANAESTAAFLVGLSDIANNPVRAGVALTAAAGKLIKAKNNEFYTDPNAMINKLNSRLNERVQFGGDVNQFKPVPYAPQPLPPRLEDTTEEFSGN